MMFRWVVATGLAAATLIGTMHAPFATRPTVTFELPSNRITAGKPFVVTYASRGLSHGTTLYLQKQEGTAHVWRSVLKLKGETGSANAPKVGMGLWRYRVDATIHGASVASSATKSLFSYGGVSFGIICRVAGGCGSSSGDVQIGSSVYVYQASYEIEQATYPTYTQEFNYSYKTSCASARITFAGSGDFDGAASFTTYAQVVQTASDAVTASAASGSIGSLSVKFDGGPWIFNMSATDDNFANVYANGTFRCYTSNGRA
jgi:hypothetical protein